MTKPENESRYKQISEPYMDFANEKSKKRRCFVECECICGTKKRVLFQNLKRGLVKSCGCLRNDIVSKLNKERSYNMPMNEILKDFKNGMDCADLGRKYGYGKFTIRERLVNLGLDTSVKINKNNKRYTGYEDISGSRWDRIRKMATERCLDFLIDIKWAWLLFIKQKNRCALSGVEITFPETQRKEHQGTASLDRIDSSLGYTEENVQWVHKRINIMKGDMSDSEFIDWCKIVVDYTNRKAQYDNSRQNLKNL